MTTLDGPPDNVEAAETRARVTEAVAVALRAYDREAVSRRWRLLLAVALVAFFAGALVEQVVR